MKYEDFKSWIEKNCMYETFYEDSEGRIIMILTELDAWAMCNKFAEKEREVCAKLCETLWNTPDNGMATEEECYGDQCAEAIRARGET